MTGKKKPKQVPYDHLKLEKKWQKEWEKKGIYKAANSSTKKKMYVLDMFPYPSGSGLHVGHPRGYIASDVYARMKRMEGYNVLHPMGFDSFGLPAEQYAIQTGKHPGPFTETLVKRYKEQLSILGFSYDWEREVATHRPEFYKWTQWIFLQLYGSWYDAKKKKARPIEELVSLFEKSGTKGVHAVRDAGAKECTASEWKACSKKEQEDILMQYRLAYEGYSEVNWCEELGTVLANDEIVDGPDGTPVSERGGYPVVKKVMRQWFLRITAYAERLLEGLEGLDWSPHIKEIQRNWIGKSEGAEINFTIADTDESVKIFTTRPDTIFGATYVVLAPEHALVAVLPAKNKSDVEAYIAEAKKKSVEDRADAKKEKTGVMIEGVVAINPVNGEEIPVWIADYVLAGYGTGAVMAVPAHDERDFAFAKKYDLPIKQVVVPCNDDSKNPPQQGMKEVVRETVIVHLQNKTTKKFALLEWHGTLEGVTTAIMGGIEEGQSPEDAARKEIEEESAITGVRIVKKMRWVTAARYCASHKNENRKAVTHVFLVEVDSIEKQGTIPDAEKKIHTLVWEDEDSVMDQLTPDHQKQVWSLLQKETALVDDGFLMDSGEFSGMDSVDAKKKITEFVGGKWVTKFKMRDAVFARQRYWGEPIPLVHKEDGTIEPVPEKKLPLELPKVKSYAPSGTGESPLASIASWKKAGYETNTMPGWAGSSWYFLRYMDPSNTKMFAGERSLSYWKDVDVYVGGQEHATGHLLYARLWHKLLHDLGYVPTDEPFKALRNQGMILGTDHRKMSKRWGNVVNPDDVVKTYGADTMRVFECFIGPFDSTAPWSTEGIIGSRRFIERVWRTAERVIEDDVKETDKDVLRTLHQTIKKVSEDIPAFSFNTSVSAMMIFVNTAEGKPLAKKDLRIFLKLLAPFAPHVAEELWGMLGEKKSIHLSEWPAHDERLLIADTVKIAVQVNGKVRAEIEIAADAAEKDVIAQALKEEKVAEWTSGKTVARTIYVKGRLVNIVCA